MTTLVPALLDGSSSFLQAKRPTIKPWIILHFSMMSPLTSELAALGTEKSMINVVTTLEPLFFIGSSSFLHVTRTSIKSQMGLKFCLTLGCVVSCPQASRKISIDI